ncbi:MAG: cobyric acid synthase [Bacteroidaceae bacterium]|nr:cobyric acid synthase [Bacteroidaceae bacterium]
MLNGHGDDAYRYEGIRHNFSSNIFSHADLGGLKTFLATRLDTIDHYPEPEPRALERLIAERSGVGEDCVLVTNGATEAIYLIAQSRLRANGPTPLPIPPAGTLNSSVLGSPCREESGRLSKTVIFSPTFSEYADACRMAGLEVATESVGCSAAVPQSFPLVWLCNPNNPTGTVLPREDVLRLAAQSELLVLDQSYEDYTLETLLTPAEAVAAGNILQLHSLTKRYAVPGLRIGYVVGAPALIEQLRRRLHPWSVNALAIEAALWLIKHDVKVIPDLPAYLAEAQRLRQALAALPGITVEPTQTNFMLCRLDEHGGFTAAELKDYLATHHSILIRDASNFEGLTSYHFRVAAQTKDEDDLLIDSIKKDPLPSPPRGGDHVLGDASGNASHPSGGFRGGPRGIVAGHPIMLCGTGSDVGKSVLATALCRIFLQDGYHPAPFKAQNMALNSYATPEGLEIGRAQAVQAEAAGIPCHTDMNPLLLKPQSDHTSQVVLHGKPIGNRDAYDYWRLRPTPDPSREGGERKPLSDSPRGGERRIVAAGSNEDISLAVLPPTGGDREGPDFRAEVCAAYDRLAARYNPIVMEGAGSISELNLRDTDLVNLPMARYADAAVILVADIDRGGVFASVYGSIALQTPEDRARIKGIIINKFRGDLRLFDEGRKMIEELCGVPVLGVIPYAKDIHIEEEDSVSLEQKQRHLAQGKVNIAVVLLRHISNFTDFNALERDPRVNLFYSNNVEDLQRADIIVLPGTKATLDDLLELRRNGCAQAIQRAAREGHTVVGICGGYQMMGQSVQDPDGIEGSIAALPGLGLLPITTTMTPEKTTQQVNFLFEGQPCKGYEIHQGISTTDQAILRIDHCIGTYIHGFLDNAPVIEALLAPFADRATAAAKPFNYAAFKEEQYNRLADHVRHHLDMDKLYEIMKIETLKY